MKNVKTIALWILAIFFALSALVYFPSFSSLFALILVCLIIPIPKWQNILLKFIRGKLKVVIATVLALLTIFTAPITDSNSSTDIIPTIATEHTTVPTDQSSTELTTAPVTEPTTTPATEPNDPTTEPATTPVTEPTTPATEPTTPSTEPSHTHKYNAATCTKPKTCACGATEGEAKGHSWKAATCKAPKTCKTCGTTTGNVADHSWKAATCKAPKTCTTCGITEGTTKEHSWKNATYSSPKKCSSCGKTEGSALDKPGKGNYHGHVYTGGSSSTKFHYEEKCPGKNSHEITWKDVDKLGLKPCGTCVLK